MQNDQVVSVGCANDWPIGKLCGADECSVEPGCTSGSAIFECLCEAQYKKASRLIRHCGPQNAKTKKVSKCYEQMSDSVGLISFYKLISHRFGPAAKYLSTGLLISVFMVSQPVAQVSIEEIEAALSALEDSAGIGSSDADTAAISPTTPPPSIVTTPPPGELGDTGFDPGANQMVGGMPFMPILSDQVCPTRLADIGEQAQALTARARAIEIDALEMTKRFAVLEDQNRAYEIDQDLLECPPDFIAAAEDFKNDLSRMELASVVQEAESFSVCAQVGLQALNERMSSLAESNDPNAGADRLAVGGILRRWATSDAEVTEAVSNFVFYDQRRGRLEAATNSFLRRCELLGGY